MGGTKARIVTVATVMLTATSGFLALGFASDGPPWSVFSAICSALVMLVLSLEKHFHWEQRSTRHLNQAERAYKVQNQLSRMVGELMHTLAMAPDRESVDGAFREMKLSIKECE